MEVAKVARQRFLDDVVNSVGETFLAHSLQCARCHDHKFDPIPTRDYYSIQAVFATTQLAELPAAFLPEENQASFEERRIVLQRREEYLRILQELDQTLLKNADQWFSDGEKIRDLEGGRRKNSQQTVSKSAKGILGHLRCCTEASC